ncbi:RNA polymerase sigma-70 factor (ECF subfamily) [Ulvibacter sp. MAR_2010_11]|uniref:RNA polymerase sigma factor n=1 Tax=Ulvibacter sp. MAR_2010_11 TaxID=1250229 RepID=UPI000C2CA121|nr:RNA polymerase sigma factor [Ulvibacter sp. MAR_2010_11]PKA82338.1 RNA polymerase sigma-70 factor (ECF subfamily) [Ulvibacter sp. MAR_2010_11]
MKLDALINACKENNREAQNELFLRYKDSLFLLSLKYCRNEADAEDNLHDAFVTIFSTIKKYKSTGSFEGWMKRITIYKAIDKYKKQKAIPVEINDNLLEDPTLEIEPADLPLDIILKLIQELPDQYRWVFNLYQMDDYSHREVAEMLKISESTSKSNYHRAKMILRDKIMQLNSPAIKMKA